MIYQAYSQDDSKNKPQRRSSRHVTRVMSITSGKGGAGKTHATINLAIALARQGRSVLILDADLGLANVDIMLGLRAEHTMYDVLEGRRTLEEIMLNGPDGISIIPASSGIEAMTSLNVRQRLTLLDSVEQVAGQYDYLIIDTAAGIGPDVMHFNSAASEVVCVITSEPTSITDAYATIKVLATRYGEKSVSILANNVPNEAEAKAAYKRLSQAVERFLHIRLNYLGHVPMDACVNESVSGQRALLELHPSSAAARAISLIAKKIDSEFNDRKIKGGLQLFFQQLLEVSAHGVA